jgi:cytochrome P450
MSSIAPIADFDDRSYDQFAMDEAAFGDVEDIYALLAPLRARAPVHEGDLLSLLGWATDPNFGHLRQFTVLAYKEFMEVDADIQTFSIDAYEGNLGQTFGRTLSLLNSPEHPRIRRVFQQAFLPTIVAKWGDQLVTPVVNELIDAFIARGKADLAEEFALKYPFEIIYRQLRLPKRCAPGSSAGRRTRPCSWKGSVPR